MPRWRSVKLIVISVLCFDDKTRISGVRECKCCLNMKKELKDLQDELTSAKLIIKPLQSESNSTQCAGYRTIEPRNLIQCRYVNANKAKVPVTTLPSSKDGVVQRAARICRRNLLFAVTLS
jgi:hypothetical protein